MIESKEFKKWYKFIRTISTEERMLLLKNKMSECRSNPSDTLKIQISIIKRIMVEKKELID